MVSNMIKARFRNGVIEPLEKEDRNRDLIDSDTFKD